MRSGRSISLAQDPATPACLPSRESKLLRPPTGTVYDFLVNKELLRLARTDAEKISVGRRCEADRRKQSDITVILDQPVSRRGRGVPTEGDVRSFSDAAGKRRRRSPPPALTLKLYPAFQRGRCGVLAYAGIPITHRDVTSTVTFIAGDEDPEK